MDSPHSNGNHHPGTKETASQGQPARRRSPWPLAVVAAPFILLPFLSWYGTTFWRELDDDEIEKYLNDEQKPRHVQHALEQIDRRIVKGDEGVRRWYPQVLRVAENPLPDL